MIPVRNAVPLQSFNTFNIPVSAAYYWEATSVEALQQLCASLSNYKRVMVLGGGSNVLFRQDFDGLVIHNRIAGRRIEPQGDAIHYVLGGGENWHDAVRYSVELGYFGLENLSLIPGTVGAAPVQNIGAYGVELKDLLVSLLAVDLQTGELRRFTADEAEFGYRDSFFKRAGKGRFCIVEVTLKLYKETTGITDYGDVAERLSNHLQAQGKPASPDTITAKMVSDIIIAIRQEKLPDPAELPNAGSFFKNPIVTGEHYRKLRKTYPELIGYSLDNDDYKLAAGWLIDQLGWKGKCLNGACVHAHQALVLINKGGGSAAIMALAEQIQQQIHERYNVVLESEPEWI